MSSDVENCDTCQEFDDQVQEARGTGNMTAADELAARWDEHKRDAHDDL